MQAAFKPPRGVIALVAVLSACGDPAPRPSVADIGASAFDGGVALSGDAAPADAGSAALGFPDATVPDSGPSPDGGVSGPPIVLRFGANVSSAVADRVAQHVHAVARRWLVVAPSPVDGLSMDALIISIGDTVETREVIDASELNALGSEGFIVRTSTRAGVPIIVADGNSLDPDRFGHTNLGVVYGAYRALELLGFAFLHPLAPTRPSALPTELPQVDESHQPRWRIRGMQIHTMHPLELTDLLNGWGPGGTGDGAGWRAMLPDWSNTLEWLVANRQNRVQWVLLNAASWATFGDGVERIARLGELVTMAHGFGLAVGVDTPIALHQQHAHRLLRQQGELVEELAEIRARIDHLMGAGFDYLATENGSSEFTAGDDMRMLAWMNEMARHLDEAHDADALIKIHISSGQFAESFTEPFSSEPLNFNLLPYYADSRVGVMPHTVQTYALDDDAPTYGNDGFAFMREYLQWEVGRREVVWHPETAYWVSFDIDVPLFLPLYAERRYHDLRLLAGDEDAGRMGRGMHAGGRMDGQITFSSGWEWGYWLNDVVTARAAWQPGDGDEQAGLTQLIAESLAVFGDSAQPVAELLVRLAVEQKAVMIDGEVNGRAPREVNRRNGHAYLQGFDTWDDVADLAKDIPGLPDVRHQPDKLGLVEMRNPLHDRPGYSAEVEPMLAQIARTFRARSNELAALRSQTSSHAFDLFDDLNDAAEITALRAEQLHGLYDYVDGYFDLNQGNRRRRLATARAALDSAAEIVARREARYRVAPERVASWRNGPTAYEFGYLWTVRTLHYWWRDEGKAVDAPVSPCYLNIINALDVGFGEGLWADVARVARQVLEDASAINSLSECLAETRAEPTYPQDNLRSRP